MRGFSVLCRVKFSDCGNMPSKRFAEVLRTRNSEVRHYLIKNWNKRFDACSNAIVYTFFSDR